MGETGPRSGVQKRSVSSMDTKDPTTTNLIVPQEAVHGRPKGSLAPATVKNAIFTDALREEWHDPAITVLRMTLPEDHPQYEKMKLPYDKEQADTLVKLCKYFHHPRTPIKTDGNDSDNVKKVSFLINMPSPDNLPIINGHAKEIDDDL